MEDPGKWKDFDNLDDAAKAVFLERFMQNNYGTLDAFKRLSPADQQRMLLDLIRHNAEDLDKFMRMSPQEQAEFLHAFVQNNLDYLMGLTPEEYEALCESAMRKYKAFKVVHIPPSKPPSVRPAATGGPYTYEELRHIDWLPPDVAYDQRELF
eukprot:TRINITY_DN7208_c0_g1_i1.p1 TRINITY_DN7208_c0_g1~~TRINITY_DN7208_c0_g1_i1.p1  ORF type:complete len:153 (-),score=23.62 TRINITY_DN7208_c0_g1_i1:214-672(-)